MEERFYNEKDNYFFLDYTLWEHGHPEYVEKLKKDGELPICIKTGKSQDDYKGTPRWIRMDFLTSYELMTYVQRIIGSPYPHRYENIRIHSDLELSEEIVVEKNGSKILYPSDKGYKDGDKMTRRMYEFGDTYERISKRHKEGTFPITVNS